VRRCREKVVIVQFDLIEEGAMGVWPVTGKAVDIRSSQAIFTTLP
jgi:hypothetical protein